MAPHSKSSQPMITGTPHRPLIAAALALAAGSAAVFGTLAWRDRPAAGPVTVQLADAPYTPAIAEAKPVTAEAWTPPPPQTRGRDWVYDTFTPPEIFYHARARQFTVKPPMGIVEEEAPVEAFGLELVDVRPEAFRLQLVGYYGETGNWRGTFQNLLTGEVVGVARAVVVLVRAAHDEADLAELLDGRENPLAEDGVGLDEGALLEGERAWLREDA